MSLPFSARLSTLEIEEHCVALPLAREDHASMNARQLHEPEWEVGTVYHKERDVYENKVRNVYGEKRIENLAAPPQPLPLAIEPLDEPPMEERFEGQYILRPPDKRDPNQLQFAPHNRGPDAPPRFFPGKAEYAQLNFKDSPLNLHVTDEFQYETAGKTQAAGSSARGSRKVSQFRPPAQEEHYRNTSNWLHLAYKPPKNLAAALDIDLEKVERDLKTSALQKATARRGPGEVYSRVEETYPYYRDHMFDPSIQDDVARRNPVKRSPFVSGFMHEHTNQKPLDLAPRMGPQTLFADVPLPPAHLALHGLGDGGTAGAVDPMRISWTNTVQRDRNLADLTPYEASYLNRGDYLPRTHLL